MGRQHTPEEKLAANRAKSKRHYEKYSLFLFIHYISDECSRLKNSINKRRRRKYQKANQKRLVIIGSVVQSNVNLSDRVKSVSTNLAPETNTCPIDTWLEHTTHVQGRFNKLIKNDPKAYLESICTRYLADHDKDVIQKQTILLAKLQKLIYKCHNEVLQLVGVGDELSCVENVKKIIWTTVSWVEEVFCHAIVNWTEVQHLYHEQSFLYQKS